MEDEASVMISVHLMLESKNSTDRLKAFLSILGDCRSTSRLSTVLACRILPDSIFNDKIGTVDFTILEK